MKVRKRIIALLLTIMMLITMMPISTFAATISTTVIGMEETWASAGTSVRVEISVKNNPGIIGGTLTVSWPKELTLRNDENGSAFEELTYQQPSRYVNTGTNFVWYGSDVEEIVDGTILSLTFDVPEDAVDSAKYPITISGKGFSDVNEKAVEVSYVSDCIRVVNYLPGDVSGDGLVSPLDLVTLARYISDGCITDPEGYNISLNELAADVNDDGEIAPMDLILISRYISDGCTTDPNGYNIVLKPSSPKCSHIMKATAKVDASCTENGNIAYWHCTECDKYYSDEDGKTEISLEDTVIPASHNLTHYEAKAATEKETGCIEHWKCSVCKKYFTNSSATVELTKSEVIIPVLERLKSTVVYNVYGSDPYLESVGVDNSMNQTTFYSVDGLVLNDLVAPKGYTWKGWSTADGTPVTEIPPHSISRQIVLNANWSKTTYKITFDTPDVTVKGNKITGEQVTNYTEYTVDTGVTLNEPQCYGYTFVGWSNDDGFLIETIAPGTADNMTLHANWTSNRNRATSYADYGEPTIIEDDKNGQFLFIYDIGRIDNVPLNTYIDSATNLPVGANGTALNIDMEYSVKEEFNKTSAEEVIQTVANATTRSSGWTLSKEWNDLYEEGTGYEDKQVKTEERIDSQGNVVGGNYFVSNSQGGSSFVSTESGGSSSNSSKVTTENSYGINQSYDKSTEKYCDAKLGVSNETEVSAGAEFPVKIVDVSVGIKNTTTVGAEVSNGRKDNEAFHVDQSASGYIGTVKTNDSSSYYNTVANQSSNWNSTTGYEKSYQTSVDTSVRNAIASEISKTTNYKIQKALGGENSESETVSGTTSNENGYSNSLKVSEYHSKTTTKRVKHTNPDVGYYRVVTAGTVHVYGVVGYDVATASYYTSTYNVLADDTFEYVDYSRKRATFDDCENGVVTFEIPYEINEYILGVTSETEGLEIGLDGKVNKFETPEKFDGTVVVPQYHAETQPGTDNIAIKTKAFSSTTFRNNTEIETVILPVYVTEIPDNAFEGCTNLKTVIAYGVTKIGANAFKGCTSLEKFSIDNCVNELGNNAFENVCEIAVMAYDSKVADAAIVSGATRITVDISRITDFYNNKTIVVDNDTDYFAIVGNGGKYSNLQITSNAKETLISKIKFVDNADTPLKIGSSTVTLSVVDVEEAPVYALHLSSENTNVKLYGEINLSSKVDNTIISKNVTLSKANNSITSILNVSGKYLVCGKVINKEEYLNVEPTTITLDEYNAYISPCLVTFDSNGGLSIDSKKIVYKKQKYGELPTPQREHFEFTGWYTLPVGGELVTADSIVNVTASQTLYAHWNALTANLVYDSNGGSVSSKNKVVYIGKKIGELPTPTRDGFAFDGWFTADGTKVTTDTVFTTPGDITLRAYWISDWIKASEMPSGAQVVDTKWSYTLREYTTNSASSLSGWTKYDTKRTSWGATQGPVYSDPSNGSRNVWPESYVTSSNYKTVYHYYRYSVNYSGGYGSYAQSSSYPNYYEYNFDSPLEYYGDVYGHAGYKWWYNGTNYVTLYQRSPFTTQEWVSDNYGTRWYYQEPVYTYYYHRDLSKEATSDPTGQSNVSNVVKWVQYRVK